MMGIDYRLKLLLTHNHFVKSTMETSLLDRGFFENDVGVLKDMGIDALSRYIRYNKLDEDILKSYTQTHLRNRLDLLIGTRYVHKNLFLKEMESGIEEIFEIAKRFYDLILIDVAAGDNSLSEQVLEGADLIVVNLNQNMNVLEDFFTKEKRWGDKKYIFLISLYDEVSKYNVSYIRRRFKIRHSVLPVPYLRPFADACNEGRAIDFFIRNANAIKGDPFSNYIQAIRNCSERVLMELNINIQNKRSGD
jgi:cellulose biosynthesis protein BcsQ